MPKELSGVSSLNDVSTQRRHTAGCVTRREKSCLDSHRDRLETQPIPTSPIIFAKFPSSIDGPEAAVVLPRNDSQGDDEVELTVVIDEKRRRFGERSLIMSRDICRWTMFTRQWQFPTAVGTGKSYDTSFRPDQG